MNFYFFKERLFQSTIDWISFSFGRNQELSMLKIHISILINDYF